MSILEVKDVESGYGEVQILWGSTLSLQEGKLTCLVGGNGVGKTTLLRTIMGLIRPWQGTIWFEGRDVSRLPAYTKADMGLVLVPEGRQLFTDMSVIENLEMGAFSGNRGNIRAEIEHILEIFPLLKDKRSQKAGVLSTGEQQVLAMGRALMQKPKLLLADEPSLGLSPMYVDLIFEKLIEINKSGTSILLVEQNARMALEICHRGYVFKNGNIFLEDTGRNLLENKEVEKVFLGG